MYVSTACNLMFKANSCDFFVAAILNFLSGQDGRLCYAYGTYLNGFILPTIMHGHLGIEAATSEFKLEGCNQVDI